MKLLFYFFSLLIFVSYSHASIVVDDDFYINMKNVMTSGDGYTCFITDDNYQCLGANPEHASDYYEELILDRDHKFTQLKFLSSSDNHVCASYKDGVTCWGSRSQRSDRDQIRPSDFFALKSVSSLSAGYRGSCAISEGELRCWGINVALPNGLISPSSVAIATSHICVTDENQVKCWDRKYNHTSDEIKLKTIYATKSPTHLSAGIYNSCVISNNEIKCWEAYGNSYNYNSEASAVKNPRFLTSGKSFQTYCAIGDGGASCWGGSKKVNSKAPPFLTHPVAISAGKKHACAIDAYKGLFCWGAFHYSQNFISFSDIAKPKKPYQIVAGIDHKCILDEEGVKCWGNNHFGQSDVPKDLRDTIEVSAGANHSCALSNKVVKCWGANDKNQLNVPKNLINPTTISSAENYNCVIDGSKVICWGQFKRFRSSDTATYPVPADKLTEPLLIDTAKSYACAIDKNNGLICWGPGLLRHYQDQLKYEKLPVDLAIRDAVACVVSDGQGICEGDRPWRHGVPKDFSKTNKIYVGEFLSCSIFSGNLKCDDYYDTFDIFQAKRDSKKYILVAISDNFACRINEKQKISCWGDGRTTIDHNYSRPKPKLTKLKKYILNNTSVLYRVNKHIKSFEKNSPLIFATVLGQINKYLQEKFEECNASGCTLNNLDKKDIIIKENYYKFIFKSLRPLLMANDSSVFQDKLIPALKLGPVKHFNIEDDSITVNGSEALLTYKVDYVLKLMSVNLKLALQIVKDEERKAFEEILQKSVVYNSNLKNKEALKKLIEEIDISQSEIKSLLITQGESSFIHESILLINNWLKKYLLHIN